MNIKELRDSSAATVTRAEVADLFGVDPRTITQGIRGGTIPAIKIGRRVVIPREPLLAMLSAHTEVA